MNHDALSSVMLWVGALFVFTPIVCAAVVLGIWHHQRRRSPPGSGPVRPGARGSVQPGG
jgi:hypothetical protein